MACMFVQILTRAMLLCLGVDFTKWVAANHLQSNAANGSVNRAWKLDREMWGKGGAWVEDEGLIFLLPLVVLQ